MDWSFDKPPENTDQLAPPSVWVAVRSRRYTGIVGVSKDSPDRSVEVLRRLAQACRTVRQITKTASPTDAKVAGHFEVSVPPEAPLYFESNKFCDPTAAEYMLRFLCQHQAHLPPDVKSVTRCET